MNKKFALLIDAENSSPKYLETVIGLATELGTVTYRRIYGDFTNNDHKQYKELLHKYSLTPRQQFRYTTGKNASDSAMIIDAMDILYEKNVDGFCLVSSDSDFTGLAKRLREAGLTVVGMGEEKTPTPFVDACDDFNYIDVLYKTEQKEKEKAAKLAEQAKAKAANAKSGKDGKKSAAVEEDPVAKLLKTHPALVEIRDDMARTITNLSDDGDYILASQLVFVVKNKYPTLNARNFGFKKMRELIAALGFEVKKVHDPNNKDPNGLEIYVKNKD